MYSGFLPVRSTYSWIPSVLVSVAFSFHITLPSLRLDDGGGTAILLLILIFMELSMWVFCRMNERENRENWALTRIREEDLSWQSEFVELNFPIVVRVKNGHLESTSILTRHLGTGVSELIDLLCVKENGAYDYAILDLVKEVAATGKAAKRNVLLAPAGGSMVFKCSVCACQEFGADGTILGFEIYESWDGSPEIQTDVGPSPSVVGPSPSTGTAPYSRGSTAARDPSPGASDTNSIPDASEAPSSRYLPDSAPNSADGSAGTGGAPRLASGRDYFSL
jgi:hypothetical protein